MLTKIDSSSFVDFEKHEVKKNASVYEYKYITIFCNISSVPFAEKAI